MAVSPLALAALLTTAIATAPACRPEATNRPTNRPAKSPPAARPAEAPAAAAMPAPTTATATATATKEIRTPTAVFRLRPGAAVRRQLGPGQADAWDIDLEAGQYLFAAFDQHGVDIKVEVFGPGQPAALFQADGPYGTRGVEEVHLAANGAGRYRMLVSTSRPVPGGYYLAQLRMLRRASLADFRRAAAERALDEGRIALHEPERAWEATAKLERAARLLHPLGVFDREGEALFRLGRLSFDAGRCQDALDLFAEAAELSQRASDHTFAALEANESGKCAASLGRQDRALAFYQEALRQWQAQPLEAGQASTLDNLAEWFANHGQVEEALRFYKEEAAVWHSLHDRAMESKAFLRISGTLRGIDNWDEALAADRQALALSGATHAASAAAALTEIGNVYLASNRVLPALQYFKQASAVPGSGVNPDTLVGLGICYRRLNDHQNAVLVYRQAILFYRQARNRRSEALAWIDLGAARRYMRQWDRAAQCYAQALHLAREDGYPNLESEALLGTAKVQRDRRNLLAARYDGEAAIGIVEELRRRAARPDWQRGLLASNADFYTFMIEILMQLHRLEPASGFDQKALDTSELERARGLYDALRLRPLLQQGPPVPSADQTERQRLMSLIAVRDRALAAGPRTEMSVASDPQLQALLERLHQLEDHIVHSRLVPGADAEPAAPPAQGDLRKELMDDHTILLEYSLGEAKSFLWAATRDTVASFELPGGDRIQQLAQAAYATLSGADRANGTAPAELSRVLLGQVIERLGEQRLVIVADGPLQLIPFAALPDPRNGEPLVLHHEIVSEPSLAVLRELRRPRGGAPAKGCAAVIADPVFGGEDDERVLNLRLPKATRAALERDSLPRLLFAGEEARQIVSLAGAGGTLTATGFDANKELAASARLRDFSILHYATHGSLRTDLPELSSLALARLDRAGRPRDGALHALEVADLDLPAELVVLGACRTALGREWSGEGIVGLPHSFMVAGARRVLVSLWDVGDQGTSELMALFYRHLLVDSMSPAGALRESQLAMWRDARWRDARSWGGFVLEGDWLPLGGGPCTVSPTAH